MKCHWAYLVALLVCLTVGCANTTANLQRETARFIGDVLPEEVAVSNVDRGLTSVKWDAQSKGATYKCSADDMVRRVHCVRR